MCTMSAVVWDDSLLTCRGYTAPRVWRETVETSISYGCAPQYHFILLRPLDGTLTNDLNWSRVKIRVFVQELANVDPVHHQFILCVCVFVWVFVCLCVCVCECVCVCV